MQWRGKDIHKLEHAELADASCTLEAIDAANKKQRMEAMLSPRYKKNNKNVSLGNRNPVFDELLTAIQTEMKLRNFVNQEKPNA